MPDVRQTAVNADQQTLLPPNDPVLFESLCLDLWREIWGDPDAQKYGRSGQKQAGVDVFGKVQGKWIGVQSKQKDALLWTEVSVKDLEEEVEKARNFKPALSSFILATTGPRDAKVQERARELTKKETWADAAFSGGYSALPGAVVWGSGGSGGGSAVGGEAWVFAAVGGVGGFGEDRPLPCQGMNSLATRRHP